MFVTNWISPTKIQKISEITNFFRHYFLSRTEVDYSKISADGWILACLHSCNPQPQGEIFENRQNRRNKIGGQKEP